MLVGFAILILIFVVGLAAIAVIENWTDDKDNTNGDNNR